MDKTRVFMALSGFADVNKHRDQALSLWSGSTDFKTLDYQRTNPMEYEIMRTHTEETT